MCTSVPMQVHPISLALASHPAPVFNAGMHPDNPSNPSAMGRKIRVTLNLARRRKGLLLIEPLSHLESIP